MVRRIFLTKCNSIFEEQEENFGLNPICMLNYGNEVSRVLIQFDFDKISEVKKDLGDNVRYVLHMFNCGSIDDKCFNNSIYYHTNSNVQKRATSFDLIFFKIPKFWDKGIGFDTPDDIWLSGDASISTEGSNWYNARNGYSWSEEGIYTNTTLGKEYNKFSNGEDSIILGRQHFEYGNENIDFDVTDYINSEDEKYGIGIAFSPLLESTEDNSISHYVGFFSNNTNTFFEPFVEVRCSDTITDDRNAFYLNKSNKLYLYANIGGKLTDLDNLPTCTIEGVEYPVKREKRGIYSAEVKLSSSNFETDEILTDIWSNLSYSGESIDDVELEFATLSNNTFFNVGTNSVNGNNVSVTLSGINDSEKIPQGDIINIEVTLSENYSKSKFKGFSDIEYRLFVKEGNKDIVVIDWDNVNVMYGSNYFTLYSDELVPNEYHIDIRVKIGNEIRTFKDELKFKVISKKYGFRK